MSEPLLNAIPSLSTNEIKQAQWLCTMRHLADIVVWFKH